MSSSLDEYDVAVTVIVRTRGVYAGDASSRATAIIKESLRNSSDFRDNQATENSDMESKVLGVMSIGEAFNNGYFRVEPTIRAGRIQGLPVVARHDSDD